MDVKKENVCRLCLKCEDDTFSPLDATSKENLKIVVPELNLDGSTNSVICSKCKDSLEESRKIKKISIETDQFIRTQIAEQKIKDKVNLNHIINKTSGEANSNANSETVNICRICLKNKEVNYMNINKAKTDSLFRSALETCLSELDLELTADPVICELCHNTLRELFSFKTGCLSVEEKVKRYCETTSEEEPDLNNVLTFLKADSKKCLGEDNFLSEFEVQDEEEADIFDIFPNFSGEEFKSTNENNEASKKRPSTEDSNVPAKKPKAINSKNVEPKAEDDLPFFSFNFNLIFNPKTEGTMEEWLSKVDELKVKFGWSDYITIHKVLVKLKGMDELYTWFSNISEIMTWEEWKKKLLQMFPVTNDYFVTLKRMINRKKRANETFIEYYNAKLQLLQDMNITGEKAVSCLIGGVTDIAVGCIARVGNYKTPEELLEYFKSCNDKKPVPSTPVREKNDNKVKGAAENKSPQQSSADKKEKKKKLKCYTCRKYGHTSKECWETFKTISNGTADNTKPTTPNTSRPNQRPRRQKKRCVKCGKIGHGNRPCPPNRTAPVSQTQKVQPPKTRTGQQAPSNVSRFNTSIAKKPDAKARPNQRKAKTNARCHNCGKLGHFQNACRTSKPATPGSQMNRGAPSGDRPYETSGDRYFNRMQEDSSRLVCFKCFRVGHDARDCMDYSGRTFRN